ncbi:chaperone modulator CbpM [Arachidicoccus terrestris]|uniref:chaperone modulator CbpM n=1 Tax=Arachidicoccus terrestris TaxID=2875539 RepID=UPI001CC721B8|nr:chaperone modulator CbpM [Arachidicoccus terrestris]UAY55031.1 chaperone modulator CbpM [Arachidicoccus terrestris]
MEASNQIETIPVMHLCTHYQTDIHFFELLQEYGLVTLIQVEQTPSIEVERIKEVEKWIHLHYDLNINMEGLDAIAHLLQKMERLQSELSQVKSRLRGFEER